MEPTHPRPRPCPPEEIFDRIVAVHHEIAVSAQVLCDAGIRVRPSEMAALSAEEEAAAVAYARGELTRWELARTAPSAYELIERVRVASRQVRGSAGPCGCGLAAEVTRRDPGLGDSADATARASTLLGPITEPLEKRRRGEYLLVDPVIVVSLAVPLRVDLP